jgi:hypothetical protein
VAKAIARGPKQRAKSRLVMKSSELHAVAHHVSHFVPSFLRANFLPALMVSPMTTLRAVLILAAGRGLPGVLGSSAAGALSQPTLSQPFHALASRPTEGVTPMLLRQI